MVGTYRCTLSGSQLPAGIPYAHRPALAKSWSTIGTQIAANIDKRPGKRQAEAVQRYIRRPAFGDTAKIELHMLRQPNAPPDWIKLDGSPRPGDERRRLYSAWSRPYLAPRDLVEISIIPQRLNLEEQRWIKVPGAGMSGLNRYRNSAIEQS
jgi:hypothetical protein